MWNEFKRRVPAPVTHPCVCFKISSWSVVVFFLRTPHKHRRAHTNRTQTRRLNANTDMYSEKINKQITNKARIHSRTHQDKYFNPRFTCPSVTNTQVNGLANNVNTLNQLREKKRWIKNTDLPAVWIQQKTRMRKSSYTEHVFPFKLN